MIPQMYNLSTAPAGSNPYSVMQATLISNVSFRFWQSDEAPLSQPRSRPGLTRRELKMYPVFSSSYPKRVAGLLAVLV